MARVTTDIDFDKPGKQSGYIHVPNSSNASGWGTLMLPWWS